MCRIFHAALLLYILLTAALHGQVFRVQGGESTLLNAQGGSVEFKAPEYDGAIGLGFYNGKFEYGASTRYQFHGYKILAGDQAIPFNLPTDVFDSSHYFSARGIGATRFGENGGSTRSRGRPLHGLEPDSSMARRATERRASSFTSASGITT